MLNRRMDELQKEVAQIVEQGAESEEDTAITFYRVKELAHGRPHEHVVSLLPTDRARAPRLSESWFC